MSTLPAAATNSKLKLIISALLAATLIAALAVFLYFSLVCPCERTPGAFLFGDVVEEEITDWSFANDVPLCQIQVWAGIRPHAVNLNCMATPQGELFLSCGNCENKYWAQQIGDSQGGRLRLEGTVYPVLFERIADGATLDQAWAARATKLQVHSGPLNPAPTVGQQRGETWSSYKVTSAL